MQSGEKIPEKIFVDYLSNNLDLIEPGLILLDREVVLRDPDGASGRVDIVARDRFQNIVVIEVKCSDKSAREAAHELFKYSEILRTQQRLSEAEFRCVLVSTHWRELRRAFSDYASRHHDAVGYIAERSEASSDDWLLSRVSSLAASVPVCLTTAQTIYLYREDRQRAAEFSRISRSLKDAGVPHHVGLMVQNDVHDNVLFPYGIYVVLGSAESSVLACMSPEDSERYPRDPAEQYVLETFLSGARADDIEMGSPERLAEILSPAGGWRVTDVCRAGAFAERRALDDGALLAQAAQDLPGFIGTSFARRSSPGRNSHWLETRRLVEDSLPNRGDWLPQVNAWLDNVVANYPNHDVAMRVFNAGLIRPILEWSHVNLVDSPMELRVTVVDPAKRAVVSGIIVELRWDGETCTDDLLLVLEGVVGDLFVWSMSYPHPTLEERVADALGISFHVYELVPTDKGFHPIGRLQMEGDRLDCRAYDYLEFPAPGRVSFCWRKSRSFCEFVRAHRSAIDDVQVRKGYSIIEFHGRPIA